MALKERTHTKNIPRSKQHQFVRWIQHCICFPDAPTLRLRAPKKILHCCLDGDVVATALQHHLDRLFMSGLIYSGFRIDGAIRKKVVYVDPPFVLDIFRCQLL